MNKLITNSAEANIQTRMLFRLNVNIPTRIELLENKRHLVVPVIMMKEGVFSGSGGPMLYLNEEISPNPAIWNGVPVPIFHPEKAGNYVSANSPDMLELFNAGRLFNATFEEGKLKAEAWLDMDKTEAVYPGFLTMVQNGEQIDISTAMHTGSDEMVSGTWTDGKHYNGIVRDIKPDHLALLPGQAGAFGWEDGMGIRYNSKQEEKGTTEKTKVMINGLSDEELRQQLRVLIAIKDTGNVYCYLKDIYSHEAGKHVIYEVEEDGKSTVMYKQAFDIEEGQAILVGQPVVVEQEYVETPEISVLTKIKDQINNFLTKANPSVKKDDVNIDVKKGSGNKLNNNKEEKAMKEKVNSLIANGVFEEGQRETLMAMDESVLDSIITANGANITANKQLETENKDLKANAEKAVKEKEEEDAAKIKANGEEEPMTQEQYIANAPGDLGKLLKEGIAMRETKKTELIGSLTANKENPFTEGELKEMDIPELKKLVTLSQMNAPADYAPAGGRFNAQELRKNEKQEDGSGVPDAPGFEALCDTKQ